MHVDGVLARVEGHGWVSVDQVATWCGTDTRVTLTPVIDTTDCIAVDAYEVPDRLREQVLARDPTCVFRWCTRPARNAECDHVIAYADRGPTRSCNLAPGADPTTASTPTPAGPTTSSTPGTYLWTTPHGHRLRRDPTGTTPPRPTMRLPPSAPEQQPTRPVTTPPHTPPPAPPVSGARVSLGRRVRPHARGCPDNLLVHPSRIEIAVAVVAMTVIVASASVFATLLVAVGTCDGDGGFPYSAANSTAGRFCDSAAAGPYFVVEALVPTLCLILLGVLAWVQRSWVRLVQGAVVAVVIAVALAAVVLELPSACPNPTSTQPECQTS